MNKEEQLLNLLGLAQRAGKLVSGEDLVIKSIQSNQAQLVFLAQDAGPNLRKTIEDKSRYYKKTVVDQFSTQELSLAIGRQRKVLSVVDSGFAKKMRSIMS